LAKLFAHSFYLRMEQHGNTTTFNVENVLRQNILSSDYYQKTCEPLTTWDQIVDEIYEHVDHVEPWMSGNARGPSSAFCLMYRLFTLKPNVKQIKDLIDHVDSPYIRAVRLQTAIHVNPSIRRLSVTFTISCCWAPFHAGGLSLPEICGRPKDFVGLVSEVCG
jgi:hypothetical protein